MGADCPMTAILRLSRLDRVSASGEKRLSPPMLGAQRDARSNGPWCAIAFRAELAL